MDISQTWGLDLVVSPYGDLATSSGTQEAIEQVSRYLMTSPGDDPFNPDWGFGAGADIGSTLSPAQIKGEITAGLRTLDTVDQTVPPTVSVVGDGLGTVVVTVGFTAASGQAVTVGPLTL